MTKKTLIIVSALTVTGVGASIAMSEYSRKPETALEKTEVASITATDLLAAFVADEQAANAKYVGQQEQAIRVTGTIRSVGPESGGLVNVVLETNDAMAGIVCEFAKADVPASWKPGDHVTLKGICTGYLIDVILNRCGAVE